MSKSTKKKEYKKRYDTRLEKNRKIYYNNKNVKEVKQTNTKEIFTFILIISLLLNTIFAYSIINLKTDKKTLNKENDQLEEANTNIKDELEETTTNYKNYLFLGDSITDFYDLDEYFPDEMVVNSGISGNKTEDILNDMKERIYKYNPSKIFLLIGTNDLNAQIDKDEIVERIKKIVEGIEENRGSAKVYIESIYPVNEELDDNVVEKRNNEDIKYINSKLKEYCEEKDLIYINTYDELTDDNGNFSEEYTDDGLHPNDKGYEKITEVLKKYLDE